MALYTLRITNYGSRITDRLIITVTVILAVAGLVVVVRPAQTGEAEGSTVTLPPVKFALLLPAAKPADAELLQLVGEPTFLSEDFAALKAYVEAENPAAIVIHAEMFDRVDGQSWGSGTVA